MFSEDGKILKANALSTLASQYPHLHDMAV